MGCCDTVPPLWEQYKRICKENAAIVLFSQMPFTAQAVMSNPGMFRYEWIYEKTKAGGFLNARRIPMNAHESVLVFYERLPNYHPQMQDGKPYKKTAVTNGDGRNYGKFERSGETHINKGERFPRSVIRFSNDNNKALHPTQKPVSLLEYLIRTCRHVVYVGGVAPDGRTAKDTRTAAQKAALERYVRLFHRRFPSVRIVGHNELNSGKACPSFDVQQWLEKLKINN